MSIRQFLIQLVLISIVLWILLFAIIMTASLSVPLSFITVSIVCFVLFNLFIFFFAKNTSESRNLFSFNNAVILSLILKLVMAISILMIYEQITGRVGTFHAIMFLFIYLAYTGFEINYLMKLARSNSNTQSIKADQSD